MDEIRKSNGTICRGDQDNVQTAIKTSYFPDSDSQSSSTLLQKRLVFNKYKIDLQDQIYSKIILITKSTIQNMVSISTFYDESNGANIISLFWTVKFIG